MTMVLLGEVLFKSLYKDQSQLRTVEHRKGPVTKPSLYIIPSRSLRAIKRPPQPSLAEWYLYPGFSSLIPMATLLD